MGVPSAQLLLQFRAFRQYLGGGTDDGRGSSAQDVKRTHRNLHISHPSLLPKWSNPQEHYSAYRMTSVLHLQRVGTGVRSELRTNAGSEVRDQIQIALVAHSISLHTPYDVFPEIRRFRLVAEQQFVRAIRVFNSAPNVIAFSATQRGFCQVTVQHQARFQAPVATPKQST